MRRRRGDRTCMPESKKKSQNAGFSNRKEKRKRIKSRRRRRATCSRNWGGRGRGKRKIFVLRESFPFLPRLHTSCQRKPNSQFIMFSVLIHQRGLAASCTVRPRNLLPPFLPHSSSHPAPPTPTPSPPPQDDGTASARAAPHPQHPRRRVPRGGRA